MGQNWTSWSQTWSTKSTKAFALKTDVLALQADQRLKQNDEDLPLLPHLQELYLFVKDCGLILNQELNRISLTQWQKDWILFSGMDRYLEKKMDRLNSGDQRMIFGTFLTRKDFNIVLTRQDKKFFISELFKVNQDAIHWSNTPGQCVDSEQFLRIHLSYRMCSQFTLHHQFRIDTGRTKFKQGKTAGILYGCESHAQGSQRSVWAWFDQTTSCIVQAEEVIEVLSNKM